MILSGWIQTQGDDPEGQRPLSLLSGEEPGGRHGQGGLNYVEKRSFVSYGRSVERFNSPEGGRHRGTFREAFLFLKLVRLELDTSFSPMGRRIFTEVEGEGARSISERCRSMSERTCTPCRETRGGPRPPSRNHDLPAFLRLRLSAGQMEVFLYMPDPVQREDRSEFFPPSGVVEKINRDQALLLETVGIRVPYFLPLKGGACPGGDADPGSRRSPCHRTLFLEGGKGISGRRPVEIRPVSDLPPAASRSSAPLKTLGRRERPDCRWLMPEGQGGSRRERRID